MAIRPLGKVQSCTFLCTGVWYNSVARTVYMKRLAGLALVAAIAILVIAPSRTCLGAGYGTPAPTRGVNDEAPAISDDGRTVIWYHQARYDTRLCVATAPFEKPADTIKVDVLPWKAFGAVLSGNGQHVFWGGEVMHVQIVNGKFTAPERLPQVLAGSFGLCASSDGSRLAMLIDGPCTSNLCPSWRAVATAWLEDGAWRQSSCLTPTNTGSLAGALCMEPNGRVIFFGEDVYSEKGKQVEAVLENGTWTKTFIPMEGIQGRVCGASDRGLSVLVQKESQAAVGARKLFDYYVVRWANGTWRQAESLVQGVSYSLAEFSMSSSGDTLVLKSLVLAAESNTVTNTEFRACQFRNGVWTSPRKIFETSYSRLIGGSDICVSRSGAIALKLYNDRGRELIYFADQNAGTKEVNLSALVK